MSSLRSALALLLAVGMAVPQSSPAQLPPAPAGDERRAGFCFHPRTLARCGTFAITETVLVRPLDALGDPAYARVAWELGIMRNRSPTAALGGSIMLSGNEDLARLALKVRYRRWLVPGIPLDVAPGVIVLGSQDDFRLAPMLGFTGHVGLSFGDVGGGFTQIEIADHPGAGVRPRLFVGARVGSVPGIIVGVGAALMIALASAVRI